MQEMLKQVCGIDVSKNELVCCIGSMDKTFTTKLSSSKTFSNNEKGFEQLVKWVNKLVIHQLSVRYIMEATGVYHEKLAYYLHAHQLEISVVLPNKISNYFRTLDTKTITDQTAAAAITLFGLERKLDNWQVASGVFRQLRQLVRERDQIVQARSVAKNQLHAECSEAYPNNGTIGRIKQQIAMFNTQIKQVMQEIEQLVKRDKKIKEDVELLSSIPGVGVLSSVTVLAETNGFNLIRNKKQLSSYAGLDVREKQSGISVKGKPRISKKGNKHLRKVMHMPALAAIRTDEHFKAVFQRLVSRHGIKMKAVVAVQRKLLELMYTLYKKQEKYDKLYFKNLNQCLQYTQ